MHKLSAHAFPLMLAIALVSGGAPARAESPAGAGTGTPQAPSAPGGAKPAAKKKTPRPGKRRRHAAATVPAADSDPRHAPDKGTTITAFPTEQAAMSRAFAEDRRELVADAERTARAPKQEDRWPSVLFAIRNLDSKSAPEVCFWRTVAYYRLGDLARARKTRQLCELPSRDVASLDHEDAAAANLQPPAALPELRMAGDLDNEERPREGSSKPVANPEPYAGPSPSSGK